MPISGTFLADFSSFQTACAQAEVSLKGFETGSNKVETSVSRMANALSGTKIVQEATIAAAAVDKIGGVSKLTERELQRVGATAQEAAAKMKAMGVEVPPGIQRIVDATQKVPPAMSLAGKASSVLTSAFGQFTAANLAAAAISKVVAGVGEFINIGIKLPAVEASFSRLTAGMQQDGQRMLANMTTATKGMVSNYDLMLTANKAMLLGLPVTATSMGELAKTATILGRAMGQDATTSLNDLITALGRSSPMILDNLGLTVKVGEANEAYALKLGKSADALTDSEKKMAFYEAAMEAAKKKTAELGDQTQTLGEIITSIWTQAGNTVSAAAGTVNIGIGQILSSKAAFLQFLKDSGGSFLYMGQGIQMAAARVKDHALALQFVGPIQEKVTVATKDYTIELVQAMVEANHLTAAQLAGIDAAQRLGKSTEDITAEFHVSAGALKVLAERTKERTEATKLAADEVEKAARVEAAAVQATSKLWEEYARLRVEQGGTANQIAIARINEWAANTEAAAIKAGTATTAFYTALAANSAQKMASIGVDWDMFRSKSIPALQETADNAGRMYNAMLSSGKFFRADLEAQLETWRAAQDAARGFGDAGENAFNRVTDAARRLNDELERKKKLEEDDAARVAKEKEARRTAGGSFDVTKATLHEMDASLFMQYFRAPKGETLKLLEMGFSLQNAFAIIRSGLDPAKWEGDRGPRVPGFEKGGPVTSDGLIYAHAGEYVIPKGGGSGGVSVTVNLYGTPESMVAQVEARVLRAVLQGRKLASA